ncbi:mesencephalic astrocyte-derived neurotrophic factor homolog [Amphiura filiformis]|uniref:mesencephalic astrocyte-derived neurotrophic factor homolog n=1 Tax=Amphiura filiformis TaxID=82378 RepID=UPI003B20BE45
MNVWVALCVWIGACIVLLSQTAEAKLKEGECEVCIKVVEKIEKMVDEKDRKSEENIENIIRKFCKKALNKEERFCYYIGGTADAATRTLDQVSKKLMSYYPAEKICENLKKSDSQICELKYDKPLDWKNINLKKMKVKELKKILSDWGETCKACTEKQDFIKRIEDLKHKHIEL